MAKSSKPAKNSKEAKREYRKAKDALERHREESPAFWRDNSRVIAAEKNVGFLTKLLG